MKTINLLLPYFPPYGTMTQNEHAEGVRYQLIMMGAQ